MPHGYEEDVQERDDCYALHVELFFKHLALFVGQPSFVLLITIVKVVNEAEVDQDRTKALVKQADERLVISTAEEVFVVIGCAILI